MRSSLDTLIPVLATIKGRVSVKLVVKPSEILYGEADELVFLHGVYDSENCFFEAGAFAPYTGIWSGAKIKDQHYAISQFIDADGFTLMENAKKEGLAVEDYINGLLKAQKKPD